MAKSLLAAALFATTGMKLLRATSGDGCVGHGCNIRDIMADVGVDEQLGLLQMRKTAIAGDSETESHGKEDRQEDAEGKANGKPKSKGKCKAENGECSMWGDPLIQTFDSHTQDLSLLAVPKHDTALYRQDIVNGIFWLMKSDQLQLQARFAKMHSPSATVNGTFMIGLAVSGPVMKENIIEIYSKNGQVFFNGEPILKPGESQEFMQDGVVALRAFKSDDVNSSKADASVESIEADFGTCTTLLISRHSHHLNMRLTMPREEAGNGPMGGYCGNFNGNAEDDTPTLMSINAGSFEVLREDEMLFSKVFDEDEE